MQHGDGGLLGVQPRHVLELHEVLGKRTAGLHHFVEEVDGFRRGPLAHPEHQPAATVHPRFTAAQIWEEDFDDLALARRHDALEEPQHVVDR